MSIDIKGLNNLIKKVSDMEKVDITKIVEDVAKNVQQEIKSAASWAPRASQYINVFNMRKYGPYTCYCNVGLKNTEAPFEEWKNLYFHNFGYHLFYYGKPTNKFITSHVQWFDNAVNAAAKTAKNELKTRIKQAIRK